MTISSRGNKEEQPADTVMPAAGNGVKKPVSNLLLRFLTGVAAGFFTVLMAWWGGWLFRLFCLCVGGAVLYEWNAIIAGLQSRRGRLCVWLCFLLLAGAVLAAASPFCIFAVLLAGACLCYVRARLEAGRRAAFLQASAFIYAALFPVSFFFLRGGLAHGAGIGLYWTLFLYSVVWASDIGAYGCGRLCGGPKLAARISPNKTWSGAIGGVIAAVLAAACFTFLLRQELIQTEGPDIMGQFMPFARIILTAAFLSVIAQIGDLAESAFKRRFGVKDSGCLLPGHGGMMDRVDGLLPAGSVFVALLAVSGWGFP